MALTQDQLNKLVKLQLLQTFKELSDAKYLDKTITAITGLEANTVEGALAEIFGKVSVTGDYNDLSNKPTIPSPTAVKGNAESEYRTGNVNITPANIGLGNVGNFKAVSTEASQGLTDTEKSNARNNIGAGTSSFSGSYNDLTNKPTIPQLPDPSNGHQYVDLGLPSGTLWATMNVGAASETDYGNYYMYGMGSKTYDSADTPYAGTEDPLDLSKDTARVVWGGEWHVPTSAQMQELIANTTYQWVTNYKGSGINGGTFTATNGAVLFIPAAGFWSRGSQIGVGKGGNYWGSSPGGRSDAYLLSFLNGSKDVNDYDREYGYSIRPVINNTLYTLHKVSVTGDYNDLSNKPVLIQQLTISSNTSSTCSITGSSNSGKEETIIYANSGSSDVTVTVPTTYKTPDGAAIELTCKAGGYCEVSYLNIGGTIYARGL